MPCRRHGNAYATAQQRQKAYADRHRSPVTVAVGQLALLSTRNIHLKNPGSRKLLPKWIGPFKVIEQVNPVAFKLEMPETLKRLHPVFHASLLKPYQADGLVQPPPPIITDDGDVVFEVDQLIDSRTRMQGRRRITEYLVSWQGYPPEHDTWEPASNINDPELIAEYLARKRARDDAAASQVLRRSARRRVRARR